MQRLTLRASSICVCKPFRIRSEIAAFQVRTLPCASQRLAGRPRPRSYGLAALLGFWSLALLNGGRLLIGIVWIVLVPCEMLGVSAGLGYFILDSRDRLAYSELMAVVLLICVLGLFLDAALRMLCRQVVHS
ncbi:nitrate/sulfonate/bicarbonate ABC transporter permease [Pseudomonas sp. MT-1]|nr:nitrate/sulfonate/bicarbonate ABC transporter permease [Pseudomonas sp. MT-1]